MTKCASVSFNGRQLIPAPLVSISRSLSRTAGGEVIGSLYNITLNGNLLAFKGSPASSGYVGDAQWDGPYWISSDYPPDEVPQVKFDQLINKLEHFKNLFNDDGGLLEIQSSDGSAPLRAPVRIGNLNYEQGRWSDTIPYSIELESDYLLGGFTASGSLGTGEFNFPQFLSDASEAWQIEINDQNLNHNKQLSQTFRLTHNLSARGKSAYEVDSSLIKQPWEWAKDWVQQRLGYQQDRVTASGLFNLPATYVGWNYARNEQIGYQEGNYSCTESWLVATGNALEDFTVTSNSQVTDPIRQVTINGSIQGLESLNFTSTGLDVITSKWEAASGYFNNISGQLYERAYNYAQVSAFPRTLHLLPQSWQINRNPVVGNINYTYTFDTRQLCFTGANILSENFSITDTGPAQSIAIIPILGRASGPVIQSLATVTERRRQMSVEIVMLPATGCPTSSSKISQLLQQSPYYEVDDYFDAMHNFLVASYDNVYLTSDSDSWNPFGGTYSRQVEWTFGDC